VKAALLTLLLPLTLYAGDYSVTLAWDPSPSPEAVGYNIYYGPSSRTYTNHVDAGNATTVTVSNLLNGATYFFAATAYDLAGLESDYSNEVQWTMLSKPRNLQIKQ